MKVLVIPDVHLKPWMFPAAGEALRETGADRAVCLMDLADDWGCTWNLPLYEETYKAAADFARSFPETLWCIGNHDISYVWNRRESGYSPAAAKIVIDGMEALRKALPDPGAMAFIHRIDSCLFMHGGLAMSFVYRWLPKENWDNAEAAVQVVNGLGAEALWQDESPIWLRPQFDRYSMFGAGVYLQVVGHTPMPRITREKNVLSCDVFSTMRDGSAMGPGADCFALVDTVDCTYGQVRAHMRRKV